MYGDRVTDPPCSPFAIGTREFTIIARKGGWIQVKIGANQGPVKVVDLRHSGMLLAGIQLIFWIPANDMLV